MAQNSFWTAKEKKAGYSDVHGQAQGRDGCAQGEVHRGNVRVLDEASCRDGCAQVEAHRKNVHTVQAKSLFALGRIGVLCLWWAGMCSNCISFQKGPLHLAEDKFYTEVGRERIFQRDFGSGSAVLLIHGYGASHDVWSRVTPILANRYRTLSLDLPGFGRSDKYSGDYSPSGLAKKMFAFLDKKGIKEVHVVAHSWGASIALMMALQKPRRVRSLALIGAWVFEEQLPPFLRWSRLRGVGEALFTLYYNQRLDDRLALAFYNPDPFIPPKVVDIARYSMNLEGAKAAALAAARGQRFSEMEQKYKDVSQPTLLVWGREDRVSLLYFAHHLDNTLPHAHLEIIAQCGHMPMLEQPHKLLQALLPFLARQTENPVMQFSREK